MTKNTKCGIILGIFVIYFYGRVFSVFNYTGDEDGVATITECKPYDILSSNYSAIKDVSRTTYDIVTPEIYGEDDLKAIHSQLSNGELTTINVFLDGHTENSNVYAVVWSVDGGETEINIIQNKESYENSWLKPSMTLVGKWVMGIGHYLVLYKENGKYYDGILSNGKLKCPEVVMVYKYHGKQAFRTYKTGISACDNEFFVMLDNGDLLADCDGESKRMGMESEIYQQAN